MFVSFLLIPGLLFPPHVVIQRATTYMLAEDTPLCAHRQLQQFISHGVAGTAIYVREAGAISFGGNSWFAPWLEVGRISVEGDMQGGLFDAARLQFDLIKQHGCALHPGLSRLEVELGIGARWSELQDGAILLVECDREAESDSIGTIGFVGLALPGGEAPGEANANLYLEFWRGEGGVDGPLEAVSRPGEFF